MSKIPELDKSKKEAGTNVNLSATTGTKRKQKEKEKKGAELIKSSVPSDVVQPSAVKK